jgi:SAM-dependent methyltransferase
MFDRKAHWEKIYSDRDPPGLSWCRREPALSLPLISNARLAPDVPLIDIGGGASVLVDYLCAEGYTKLAVLDIFPGVLASVRRRFGEKAGRVEWLEADITRFHSPYRVSLWHDRAVFHFLTKASDRQGYVEALKHTLAPNRQAIIAAFAPGGPTNCSGLDSVQYDAGKLSAEPGEGFALVEVQSEIPLTPVNREQKFGYLRFRKTGGSGRD